MRGQPELLFLGAHLLRAATAGNNLVSDSTLAAFPPLQALEPENTLIGILYDLSHCAFIDERT